jgi:hypothetical protein
MNSQEFNALTANNVTLIEYNSNSLNADVSFAGNGIFVVPTPNVPNRSNDITGFILNSSNSEGKIAWKSITKFGISLEDLDDVDITNRSINDIIIFNGTEWMNQQLDNSGLKVLNGLPLGIQYILTGTDGNDFNIISLVDTHTFNIPDASATSRGLLPTYDWGIFNDKMNTTLTDNRIFIGDITDVPTQLLLSGDATINNTGVLTLSDIVPALTTGSYTNVNLTVNSKGLITSISSNLDTGILSINGITDIIQVFDTGISGIDFNISQPSINTNRFNIPNSGISSRGLLTSTDWNIFNDKLNTNLTDGYIFIGNAFNVPTEIYIHEAATLSNTGILTLSNSGVTAASYTNANITVGENGIITTITNEFDNGIDSLNTLTDTSQLLTVGVTGIDFNITQPSSNTNRFNIPDSGISSRGLVSSSTWNIFNDKVSTSLSDKKIWIGNVSNVSVEQDISKDATINNTGELTLSSVLISTPGYYTNVTATVDSTGRVIEVSNGSGGGLGIYTINSLTPVFQAFDTGITGSDFNISQPSISTNRFNLPSAYAGARGLLIIADWNIFNNKLSASLSDKNIWIGNGSNVATAVIMDGDATLANDGALTLSDIVPSVLPTPYTNAKITVDVKGRVTSVINGNLILSINTYTQSAQTLQVGTGGTDFAISSSAGIHTFNLPNASASARGALLSSNWNTFNSKLTSSLANGKLWIGNGSNVAVERDISGDATINNTGDLTLSDIVPPLLPISYVNATITVDSKGRVTTIISDTAILSINTDTQSAQTLQVGTGGTDFEISSLSGVHTFNLPNASASVRGALTISDWNTFNGKVSTTLTSGRLWIGNVSNVATERNMSGDATIAPNGFLTLKSIFFSVLPTPYTNINTTVNSKGLITSISNGNSPAVPDGTNTNVQSNFFGSFFNGNIDFTWNSGILLVNNRITNTAGNLNLISIGKITITPGSDSNIELSSGYNPFGTGGFSTFTTGNGGSTSNGGDISFKAGNTTSGAAGNVDITAGNKVPSGTSGSVNITAGTTTGNINYYVPQLGGVDVNRNGVKVFQTPQTQPSGNNYSLYNNNIDGTSFWGRRDYANITLNGNQSMLINNYISFNAFSGNNITVSGNAITLQPDKLYQITFFLNIDIPNFNIGSGNINHSIYSGVDNSNNNIGPGLVSKSVNNNNLLWNSVDSSTIIYSTYSGASTIIRFRNLGPGFTAVTVIALYSGVVIVQI